MGAQDLFHLLDFREDQKSLPGYTYRRLHSKLPAAGVNEMGICTTDLSPIEMIAHKWAASDNFVFADHPGAIAWRLESECRVGISFSSNQCSSAALAPGDRSTPRVLLVHKMSIIFRAHS